MSIQIYTRQMQPTKLKNQNPRYLYCEGLRASPFGLKIPHLLLFIFLLAAQTIQNNALGAPQIRITESPLSRSIQQPTITAIFEDSDGLLWIGTQHGLYKFDGAKLTEFSSNQQNPHWIPASGIKGITQDLGNRIVVATSGGGMLIWDDSTTRFRQTSKESLEKTRYLSDVVSAADGRLWVGGRSGLYLYNPNISLDSNTFQKFQPPNEKGDFSAITSDINGNTFAAFGKNLYEIRQKSNSLVKIYSGDNNNAHLGQITALALDSADRLYMGTTAGQILSFNVLDKTIISSTQIGKGSPVSVISMLYHNNSLWIGSTGGLSYSDASLSVVQEFSPDNSGLPNNQVITLTPGNDFIWVGTYQGLSTLSLVPFETFNSHKSRVFDDVLAFSEDSDKNLWVGTFDGLFLLKESQTIHQKYQDLKADGDLSDQRIMTLAAKENEIWVGFQKNGLQILDTRTLKLRTPDIPKILQLEVTKVLHTKTGATWIATFNHGLYKFQDEIFTSYLSSGSLPERSVTILHELRGGQIIASSEQHIYLQDATSGRFLPLNIVFDSQSKPPFILAISQSQSGDIWIGTKDRGLFILPTISQKHDNNYSIQVGSSDSNPLSTVYEIQFDSDGNAWCSTQSGIVKLNPSGKVLARYGETDGLQGNDFNFGASYKDSMGRIYFGGSSGYNRFSPHDVIKSDQPPNILIARVAISKDSHIEFFDMTGLKAIQLTHKDYYVQFDFSVLDFRDPEQNQYRYMLEGFDRDWIENGTRNSATYTSLPPGEYTLRVQGANSAGVWNREGLSLAVTVLPPPWLTWWAYTIYTLLFLFLFWLGKRAYDSYVIERKAREMALVMIEAEERADDEMQEQLEIHDDLVKSVYRHSVSTLNLVSDIIAIRGGQLSDEIACEVMQDSVNRVGALALLEECLYYQHEVLLADLHKFTNILTSALLRQSPIGEESITSINEVSAQPLPIEQASPLAIVLYELLENCIQHAFEDAGGANYIHVILTTAKAGQSEMNYRLTVQDNGPGIPPNIDPSAGLTAGFAIVNSMAARLSGELSFTTANGTLASLIFPVLQSQ